jgi:peptidoglycan/xylan/chitin deacetylase (PgdA/CDA1 family)
MKQIVPILLYHSIAPRVSPAFSKWSVTPELFRQHMACIRENGYEALTVTELVEIVARDHSRLPKMLVVLTFDDAFRDFYTNALPVLRDFCLKATLYVTTGYIGESTRWLASLGEGDRPTMTWEQLAEVADEGLVECGSHSHTHPQLDAMPRARAREEIIHSKHMLDTHLGREITSFAYPHGYYDLTVRGMVQEAGYLSACGVKHQISSTSDDRFALARILVTNATSLDQLRIWLAGDGLPVAPRREALKTKAWRVMRRWIPLQETADVIIGRLSDLKTRLS